MSESPRSISEGPSTESDSPDVFDYQALYEYLIKVDDQQRLDLVDRIFPETCEGVLDNPEGWREIYRKRVVKFTIDFPILTLIAKRGGESKNFEDNPNFLSDRLGLPHDTGEAKLMSLAIAIVKHNAPDDEELPKNFNYEAWYPFFSRYCTEENVTRYSEVMSSNDYAARRELEKSVEATISHYMDIITTWVDAGMLLSIEDKLTQIQASDDAKKTMNNFLEVLPPQYLRSVLDILRDRTAILLCCTLSNSKTDAASDKSPLKKKKKTRKKRTKKATRKKK